MFNLFSKKYSQEELNHFEFLSTVRPFESLDNSELELFLPIMYLRNYNKDEVVFFNGDPSQALYIVKSGEIKLSIDVKGKTEDITNVIPGRAFGFNSFLKETKRYFNAIVKSEGAEIFVLPRINISEILENHHEVKAKVMSSMVEKYNYHTENLFKAYSQNFGFFELNKIYENPD
ncbi:MAG: cyclic nucleotide-binding domain-containing protein [Reichenbachiella sp.]